MDIKCIILGINYSYNAVINVCVYIRIYYTYYYRCSGENSSYTCVKLDRFSF